MPPQINKLKEALSTFLIFSKLTLILWNRKRLGIVVSCFQKVHPKAFKITWFSSTWDFSCGGNLDLLCNLTKPSDDWTEKCNHKWRRWNRWWGDHADSLQGVDSCIKEDGLKITDQIRHDLCVIENCETFSKYDICMHLI